MAVNVEELSAALRIGDGTTPTPEPLLSILTRLLGVGEAFVELRAETAPDPIKDEAVVRMAAYLYGQPDAGSVGRYSDAWRNSGASALVSRSVVQRLGDATAEAGARIGGSQEGRVGGGDGTDQTARDAAAAAQSEIDDHEASTHNTDITARSTARNARQVGEQAQTTIETHEASTHNHDATARTAARAAQRAFASANVTPAGPVADAYPGEDAVRVCVVKRETGATEYRRVAGSQRWEGWVMQPVRPT